MANTQLRALRTFDAASLTANFQDVGAVIPFTVWRGILINSSDVDALITDQSTEEDIRLPANGTVNVSELTFPSSARSDVPLFEANVQLQIKQVTAAGTGTIILLLFGRNG